MINIKFYNARIVEHQITFLYQIVCTVTVGGNWIRCPLAIVVSSGYVLFAEAPEQTWSTEKLCGLPVVVLKTRNRAVMETWVFWTPA